MAQARLGTARLAAALAAIGLRAAGDAPTPVPDVAAA
jgi:hypothetical protein